MQEQLDQLRDLAARHVDGPAAIPRIRITQMRKTAAFRPGLYEPTHCLVVQGAKEVTIGDQTLRYDTASYFIASVEAPGSGRIIEASAARPYLGLRLELDRETLASLLPEVQAAPPAQALGFAVSPVTPELLDPWVRLLRLLDTPADIPVLAPLLEREILYRLLQGPQGGTLRQIALADSALSRVRRAIGWIRTHFDQPLRVEALAELAGMSAASFHRHFKAATAMSPLQFQKTLRLQQARRLLISDPSAARAGYAVGYESASQFSREYARLFGVPPARDAVRLRTEGAAADVASAA